MNSVDRATYERVQSLMKTQQERDDRRKQVIAQKV